MLKTIKGFFLNERAILVVIVLNALLLFLQESGLSSPFINTLDVTCSIIFIIEMVVKLAEYGFKGYWASGWNRLDGILVILSIPSLIFYFMPDINLDLSFLLVLRVLRVFRFFRLVHAFPGFSQLVKNAVVAAVCTADEGVGSGDGICEELLADVELLGIRLAAREVKLEPLCAVLVIFY